MLKLQFAQEVISWNIFFRLAIKITRAIRKLILTKYFNLYSFYRVCLKEQDSKKIIKISRNILK